MKTKYIKGPRDNFLLGNPETVVGGLGNQAENINKPSGYGQPAPAITFPAGHSGTMTRQKIMKEIDDILEKANREGLVPKKVQVIPEKTKSYWAIRWVRPQSEEEKLFSPEEKRALTNYKEFGSNWINKYLRSGTIVEKTPEKEKFFKSEIKLIDDAFKKAFPISQEIEVYRGIQKIYFDDKKGAVFSDKAFISTSLREYIARRFGINEAVKIIIPKGSKVIPLDFAISRSRMQTAAIEQRKEQEILLPRGTRFKVMGKDKNNVTTLRALLNE